MYFSHRADVQPSEDAAIFSKPWRRWRGFSIKTAVQTLERVSQVDWNRVDFGFGCCQCWIPSARCQETSREEGSCFSFCHIGIFSCSPLERARGRGDKNHPETSSVETTVDVFCKWCRNLAGSEIELLEGRVKPNMAPGGQELPECKRTAAEGTSAQVSRL